MREPMVIGSAAEKQSLRSGYNRERLRLRSLAAIQAQEPRVQETLRVHIAHGGEDIFLQVRIFSLQLREDVTQRAPHRALLLRASPRHNGLAQRGGVSARDALGNAHQRTDLP